MSDSARGYVCDLVAVGEEREARLLADARLMAAAPEMLAALERVREDINWMLNSGKLLQPSVFDYIDAALAKAKGESP